jgi:hypothetical protein
MKQIVIAVFVLALPFSAFAAGTAKPADSSAVVVQKVEPDSALKKLFDEAWAKLRTLGPRLVTGSAGDAGGNQVAGVRGAESTGTRLEPYWKGDRSADPAYAQEVSAFNQAQAAAESGDAAGAVKGFEEFVVAYPKSALKPNARFALGVAYAVAGQKEKSQATLDAFMHDYPAHPLVADARRLNDALRKP